MQSAQRGNSHIQREAEETAFLIYQKFVREGREDEAQIALNLKARLAKLAKANTVPPLPRPLPTSLSQIPLRYRTFPQVSVESVSQILPRPVWGLILTCLEPDQVLKLRLVCRLLFHLCSPLCHFCSSDSGHPHCHSLWKSIGKNWPEALAKYPEANCALIQRYIGQSLCKKAFQRALGTVRDSGCAKGRHILVENPKNEEYLVCLWCRRGLKKTLQCSKSCICGLFPCFIPNSTPHYSHKCVNCACDSPLVLKSYRLLHKIRLSHPFLEINVSGKSQEHRLFEFTL